MPVRPIACRCGGTIGAERCNRCGRSKRRPREVTPRATRRVYDREWEKTRKAQLKRKPFCEDHAARGYIIEPANEVHHVVKVSARPDLKHDSRNLRSLCKSCHSIRTRRGE